MGFDLLNLNPGYYNGLQRKSRYLAPGLNLKKIAEPILLFQS